MAAFTYVAIWPITDVDRPRSALIAEACKHLDVMAQLAGARIVGEPQWTVSEDKLVCKAPAVPTDPDMDVEPLQPLLAERLPTPERRGRGRPGRTPQEFADAYTELRELGVHDDHIARRLGYTPGYLKRHLERVRSAGLLREVAA